MPYKMEELLAAFRVPRKAPASAPLGPKTGGRALTARKIEEIRSALASINPGERDTWLTIGMSLHATGAGEESFALWDEWSQRTTQSNYDAEDQWRVWNSFGKVEGPQITLGTLFEMAKANGWTKPGGAETDEADVAEIAADSELRRDFEERLDDAEFAEIVYVIVPEIKKAKLRKPTREMLLKKAAKLAGISVRLLEDGKPKETRDQERDGYEDPVKFMEELNSRHAVVPIGGKVMIMNEEVEQELGRRTTTYSSRTDFQLRYENRSTWREGEEIDIGTFWLRSPNRRQYEGVSFSPGRELPPGYYNLWQGWTVPPDPKGSCQLYLDFIAEVICNRNAEAVTYVWKWLCHLFQRPWEIPGVALVLRGVPGTGKNTFLAPIARLIGYHYIELSNVDQLAGRFSGHMAEKLLVFANEAIWGGDKSAEGTLKALITDGVSSVESKHRDIVSRANYKRTIIASNEHWCAPKGRYDRRLAVLDVPKDRRGQQPYFAKIRNQMRKGGLRRLLYELLNFDLSGFVITEIPRCLREAGWDMAMASMKGVEKWWLETVTRGYLYYDQGAFNEERRYEWPRAERTDRVRAIYVNWCQRNRESHIEGDGPFGKWLSEFGVLNRQKRRPGIREYRYIFPPLERAQEILSEMYAIPDTYWNPPSDEE